ncbi:MAG TPA: protein kinase, partial [Polyangiaceae bacterium]
DGVARLLDFGVAKAIGRSHSTRDGRVKGKFAYMAPEHLRGEATQQSDIFAASVVLWEMLTGERLFAGDHEMEIAGKVLKGGVEPPSKHFDASLRGGATLEALAQLDALTLRGLALAPENRFESARAMAFALEACLGVASPAQVGSWVARVAGDALQKRAEMVAEIESNSAAVPRPELAERTRSTVHARAPGPADDDAPSQATSPTVSSAASPAAFAARGGRARTMVMTGGVAVILAAVGGAYVLRSGGSPSPVSPPRSASALPVRQELPTAASALPAPIETTATPDPSPSSLASAAPTPPSTTGRGQAVRRTPTPHKNHCDPPYTLDSDGRQHFKEECFH